jgi:hypothetical protein
MNSCDRRKSLSLYEYLLLITLSCRFFLSFGGLVRQLYFNLRKPNLYSQSVSSVAPYSADPCVVWNKIKGHAKHFAVFIYKLLSYRVGIVSLFWNTFQDITLRLFWDLMASTVTQLYINVFAVAVIYQDRNKSSEAELGCCDGPLLSTSQNDKRETY